MPWILNIFLSGSKFVRPVSANTAAQKCISVRGSCSATRAQPPYVQSSEPPKLLATGSLTINQPRPRYNWAAINVLAGVAATVQRDSVKPLKDSVCLLYTLHRVRGKPAINHSRMPPHGPIEEQIVCRMRRSRTRRLIGLASEIGCQVASFRIAKWNLVPRGWFPSHTCVCLAPFYTLLSAREQRCFYLPRKWHWFCSPTSW